MPKKSVLELLESGGVIIGDGSYILTLGTVLVKMIGVLLIVMVIESNWCTRTMTSSWHLRSISERRGYVKAGPYTPEVVVQHPEAVRQLSREYARAGANVIQVRISDIFKKILPRVRTCDKCKWCLWCATMVVTKGEMEMSEIDFQIYCFVFCKAQSPRARNICPVNAQWVETVWTWRVQFIDKPLFYEFRCEWVSKWTNE